MNRSSPGLTLRALAALVTASMQLSALMVCPPQSTHARPDDDLGTLGGQPVPGIYFVDPAGDDDNDGTSIAAPWKTLKHSIPQLNPGNTLYLRGGTYLESAIDIEVSGLPDAPITIRAYPGEHPIIDGSYPEFRVVDNLAWEVVDEALLIFRSVAEYPETDVAYGYLGESDGSWALVPYELQGPFGSSNEEYSETPPFYYVGPGVYWHRIDNRIYYRSQHAAYQLADGVMAPANPNPQMTPLYIFGDREVFYIEEDVGHLVFQGLDIRYQQSAVELGSRAHHITMRDCNVLGGRYHILVRGGCHDLTFDNISVFGKIPDWVTWSDVKRPDFGRPAHLFQGAAIQTEDNVDRVEIMDSIFTGVFDAIGAADAPSNFRVHHNVFDVRDDVLHLSSAAWNIEFNHNTVIRAHAGGPSWSGSGHPPAASAGTVWVHHNILDTSIPQRYGRVDPYGLLDNRFQGPRGDGFAAGRTFGMHSMSDITGPAPWKIYQNTAIVADDLYNGGAGEAYDISHFNPAVPHEVYNNIFIQLGDEWILRDARAGDGSQIHDGNLYWAPYRLPNTALFEDVWTDGSIKDDFNTLASFVGSGAWVASKSYYLPGWEASGVEADPQLDAAYVPHAAGPAAGGGIDLSGRNWPGVSDERFRGALAPAAGSH